MAYKKSIKGDNNQANELGSFNRVFIDFHGGGPLILCLFVVVLISAAIGWMMLKESGLLAFLITASIVCFFLGAGGGRWYVRSQVLEWNTPPAGQRQSRASLARISDVY